MTTAADVCRHCGSLLPVGPHDRLTMFEGDAVNVCDACIVSRTLIADNPDRATDEMLERLVRDHATTVRLTGNPLRWERITTTPTWTVNSPPATGETHRYYSEDRG